MSFQSIITKQIALLTERLNAIANNAKKIDELPLQQFIDPTSKLHVSKNGTSERLSISQIIESITNSTYDEIISIGAPYIQFNSTLSLNEIVVPATPIGTWRINNVYYSKSSATKREIPFAESGLNRFDVLLLNTFNDIVILRGEESAGIAVIPTKPVDTIILCQVYVTNNSVGNPTLPVDLSNKLDKGGYVGTAQILKDEIDQNKDQLNLKLNISDYNVYFRGKFTTLASLQAAIPVGKDGDYAIIDIGSGNNAQEYIWDSEEGWILSSSVGPSTTDALPEGSLNFYFKVARVLATTLSGLSLVVGGPIISTDSILTAFGKIQNQINEVVDSINNIFLPNTLISSVSAVRSGNTFTFPAAGYTALINRTVRVNPSAFVTTIDVASTDYKRVDLIYFKSDNTLAKIVGTESLTVAPRPDIPADSVAISFINVFGNVVTDPTPITQEISFQDVFGSEKFKGLFVRFQGASFVTSQNLIVIDPLQSLSAYLDPVNGDDVTGAVENANKPFKTLNKLLNTLPASTGETYTIYITGGTINITRKITPRNLRFVAYSNATLDFTNVMENDGTTHAQFVLNISSPVTWAFENENISLVCNYVGIKAFSHLANDSRLRLTGTLNEVKWKSTNTFNYIASMSLYTGSNIKILNLYDSSQDTFIMEAPNSRASVEIENYWIEFGRQLSGANTIDFTINNMRRVGTLYFNLVIKAFTLNVKNIISSTSFDFTPSSYVVNFSGDLSQFVNVDLIGVGLISGVVNSVNQLRNSYCGALQVFKNFSGKLGNIDMYLGGKVLFENCNITTDSYLAGRGYNSTVEECIEFKGSNFIWQLDTSVYSFLFKTYGIGSSTIKPIMIKESTISTNASTYGVYVLSTKTQSTFKEKLNEKVVRNKYDLYSRNLRSDITYIIDGSLEFLSGEFIEVPIGGLTIVGYGFDVSSISKNVSGESIFKSPSGNSGNLVTRDMQYSSGAGSVFEIIDSDGTHAIEFNDVNFINCSSIAKFSNYRQFTGTTCGFYSCADGITLEGNWSGFKLTNSNVIGFGGSGTLFKKGVSTLFSNRFYIDLNLQIATGSKICDFSDSNFSNDKSLQVVNCYVKVNGIVNDVTTNVCFPNITPYSLKSYFVNNIGIKNSNNTPYGISTSNMQTYADDAAAASGGVVAVGDTYIESTTGYFKKRLS